MVRLLNLVVRKITTVLNTLRTYQKRMHPPNHARGTLLHYTVCICIPHLQYIMAQSRLQRYAGDGHKNLSHLFTESEQRYSGLWRTVSLLRSQRKLVGC